MKLTLIEQAQRALLKLSKSLFNSLLIKKGQTNEDLKIINHEYHQASIIITEEIMSKYTINLVN